MTTHAPVEYEDIQGLVRFGHGRLTEARFFLLTVTDRAAARAWLRAAPVTSAVTSVPPPDTALQVAFTWEGLRALGLPARVADGFSAEFITGMAGEESRSRRLGDVGASAPPRWRWGAPGDEVHVLVAAYATRERFEAWTRTLRGDGWAPAFRERSCLETSPSEAGPFEPFGFRDGISQPAVDWDRTRDVRDDQLEYGNLVALGEILLGYPNEYGTYTERPLAGDADDPLRLLPPAEDDRGRRDFGRNGTYLVFRDVEQDVPGFWKFVDSRAGGDAAARRALAEAMVGRTIEGRPLAAPAPRRIAGLEARDEPLNGFTYDGDPDGIRCPVGAHVRRANPRTADFPAGTKGPLSRLLRRLGFGGTGFRHDLVASARFHRLLRRGREYGDPLPPDEAVRDRGAAGPERGLRFICLNANIARQFEFVQNAWIGSTKFGGLTGEADPLLGSRAPVPGCPVTDTYSIPGDGGLARRLEGLPAFVTVRGGAYFFLPGLRALRYLAS